MTELYKKEKVGYKVICRAGSRKRRRVKTMSVYGRDLEKPFVDLCLEREPNIDIIWLSNRLRITTANGVLRVDRK